MSITEMLTQRPRQNLSESGRPRRRKSIAAGIVLYPRAQRFSKFIGARGHIRAITPANHNSRKYKKALCISKGRSNRCTTLFQHEPLVRILSSGNGDEACPPTTLFSEPVQKPPSPQPVSGISFSRWTSLSAASAGVLLFLTTFSVHLS